MGKGATKPELPKRQGHRLSHDPNDTSHIRSSSPACKLPAGSGTTRSDADHVKPCYAPGTCY